VTGFIHLQLNHAFVRVSLASVKLHQLTNNSALEQTRKGLRLAWGKRNLHNTSFAEGSDVILMFTTFSVVHKVHNSVTSV